MVLLKAAIVDDDPAACRLLRKMLMIYSAQEDVDMAPPDVYESCESVYQALLDGVYYDMMFLDVDFHDSGLLLESAEDREKRMNGIELGTRMRDALNLTQMDIIFISSCTDFAIHSISVRPAAFLEKPVSREKIAGVMHQILHAREQSQCLFEFVQQKTPMRIQVFRIRYLYSSGRQIFVKTGDEVFSFYGKLSDVVDLTCFSRFIRIHKSYLVNPNYIERYLPNAVILQGGEHETLPISRTYQAYVEERLLPRVCRYRASHSMYGEKP